MDEGLVGLGAVMAVSEGNILTPAPHGHIPRAESRPEGLRTVEERLEALEHELHTHRQHLLQLPTLVDEFNALRKHVHDRIMPWLVKLLPKG